MLASGVGKPMLIRIAITACLVTIAAAPAWAVDYCKTSVVRGDHAALVDGLVDGAALKALRVEDEPLPGMVALDARYYSVAGGGSVVLTPYRAGKSLADKDWQAPGSVETTFGGMALHWPRFYKGGTLVRDTLIVFEGNGVSQGIMSTRLSSDPDMMTLYVGWGSAPPMPSPYGHRSQYVTDLSAMAVPGERLVVKFYDGKRSAPIGSVAFTLPEAALWNARMVTQVNALRAVSAAKTCVDAATLAVAPDDAEDEEF